MIQERTYPSSSQLISSSITHSPPLPSHTPHHLILRTSQAHPPRGLLLLYPRHILRANRVPRAHVFLHARLDAALLAARQRGAGLGDAALEAVLVEFLRELEGVIESGWRASTSTSMRAFCMAASCWIWRMICILVSSAIVDVVVGEMCAGDVWCAGVFRDVYS